MVSLNTAEARAKRQAEKVQKAAEEAAAQARLEEERQRAETEAAEAKRLEEEAAAANRRPRTDGGKPSEVDLMEDEATSTEETNAYIQQMNAGGQQTDAMDEDDTEDDGKDPERSPKKKKKQKD